ncbi:DinB superfamily protein [Aeoliella mucimassa]|uniref:DinB superfamily protein n=2 Tax=Aeoliella mucimassa TaxID=2527972 RepID=A0A518ARN5_9BACT|nr:DinB superfamily protein [Aeoliella mucimassa]
MQNKSPMLQQLCSGTSRCLDGSMKKIRHCLDQLTDEQVWWRPADDMNSIGNMMLHLAGNLRQWAIVGIGGGDDLRDRPAEFAAREPLSKDELLARLQGTVDETKQVLANATEEQLLAGQVIQGFSVTGVEILFDTIPHFQGHTQEIICYTRMQVGPAYRFYWSPSTPEEGA